MLNRRRSSQRRSIVAAAAAPLPCSRRASAVAGLGGAGDERAVPRSRRHSGVGVGRTIPEEGEEGGEDGGKRPSAWQLAMQMLKSDGASKGGGAPAHTGKQQADDGVVLASKRSARKRFSVASLDATMGGALLVRMKDSALEKEVAT